MKREKQEDVKNRMTVQIIKYGGGTLFILQVLLASLFYNWLSISAVTYLGWIVLFVGFGFFILPVWNLRKKAPGDHILTTTDVVESGLYSVVRHPMYLGWLLIISGLVLMSLHVVTILLGLPSMALAYQSMLIEEKMSREKFGESYTDYMNQVPRINIIKGILQLSTRKKEAECETKNEKEPD